MALGKYSRVDGRRSPSSYCSTVTVVVFVALCLVGVWMMTSSSVVPVQTKDVSTLENKNDVDAKLGGANDNNSSSQETEKPKEGNQDEKSTENSASDGNNINPQDTEKSMEGNQDDKSVENSASDGNNLNPQETEKSTEGNQDEKSEEKSQDGSNENGESKSKDGSKSEVDNGEEKKEDPGSKLSVKDSGAGETEQGIAEKGDTGESSDKKDSEKDDGETKSTESSDATKVSNTQDKIEKNEESGEKKENAPSNDIYPSGAQSELLNETTTQNGAFSTQAAESKNEKEAQESSKSDKLDGPHWKLCNVTAGYDYIPCLDNLEAIRHLPTTKHYEHRERHCPNDPPTCLVPLPEGYQRSIEWPTSREKIWYHNVPHTKLAQIKGHQNWVKVSGEYLTFPGGGTQFKNGALHYIDFIQQSVPDIAWGRRSRVILDVGCGVASFGGFLFDRDVLTMSLAPKDEHEAQVQFALERGIPAISAVMGTKRLPYPASVFDVVHCARCRVPWHIEGGKLLLELNRLLRPGGFFVWSATPIYQKLPEDVGIWEAMKKLTKLMCWEVVSITKDRVNKVGIAVYRKPASNECYEQRSQNEPPLCQESDDPNAAWHIPLQSCMHKLPVATSERGSQWPEKWPVRLEKSPYWLLSSQVGVYGKPGPEDFSADYEHWKHVVSKSYLSGMGINWSTVRNVMDMRAVYGGFAAALRDMNVWVMNVVPIDAPDTLPIIYERGLFGIYHDWCESFSTYPRSYDLLHADHLFSKIKKKCSLEALAAEVDRILRPEGKLIIRDNTETISEMENMLKSMHYEIRMTYSKDKEGLLCVQKTMWRPKEIQTLSYAI